MSDNNLGRLNDLGMKVGGLLIASFLALHSKSKNEAAMRFIGTGAFFASMKLWPKIFINLPAKLIHKVDPGKKYISAQGDKKDFYLDNQFLPWDITPIKDEKEQRRHQKVALQNRTLWMATAGASVPLMTALMSNQLEPVVARTIALHSADEINRNAKNIEEYIKSAKPVVKHEQEIAQLCEQYKNDPMNPEFAKKLAGYLRIHELNFKDPDWAKTVNDFSITNFQDGLKGLWKAETEVTLTPDELRDSLIKLTYKAPAKMASLFSEDGEAVAAEIKQVAKKQDIQLLSKEEINDVVQALFQGKDSATISYKELEDTIDGLRIRKSLNNLEIEAKKLLERHDKKQLERSFEEYNFDTSDLKNLRRQFEQSGIRFIKEGSPIPIGEFEFAKGEITSGSEVVQNWMKTFKWNDESFFTAIKEYNRDVVSVARGRLSKYLKLANPAIGQNADSIYTNAYSRTMKNLFKRLNVSIDNSKSPYYKLKDFVKIHILGQDKNAVLATGHISLKDIVEKDRKTVVESLSAYFSGLVKDVEFGSIEYRKIIDDLTKTQLTYREESAVKTITDKDNIKYIEKRRIQPALDKSIYGETNSSIANILSNYAKEQKTNINAIISRLAMCANFEARLKEGKILIDGTDIRKLSPEFLEIAKSLMYEGNVSQTVINNAAGTINTSDYLKVVNAVYSKEAFENEPQFVKESVSKIVNYIKRNSDFQANDKYLANSDLYGLVKDYATRLYPGMKWMKKVGIASIILTSITLLIQPVFGNIKKEFPEDNKKDKGGNN